MKTRLNFSALAAMFLAAAPLASAQQGLLSLQNNKAEFADPSPMSFTVGASGGYDSLDYKTEGAGDIDSFFIQGGVGAAFQDSDQVTPWNLGLDLSTVYYLDDTNRSDQSDYSARVTFNIAHSFSERLKLMHNFYLAYEVEPNFGTGASTALRNGQYFYGYNNFAVSYAWSERFSTTTSYTVDGIKYDDDAIAASEDRFSHTVSQQFAWAWSQTLKVVGEYRYRKIAYDKASNDSSSHFVLAGLDKAWSERTNGSFRAGAEMYESERSDEIAPYFEATLSHATSEKTTLNVFSSVGFDGSEIGNYGSRYTYRVGANATNQVTKRLAVNGGLNYAYSTFDGVGLAPDVNEHELSATAGLGYRLWENVSMDANYSYTLLTSDDALREYDRNRISLGLSASF
jgi:hypothetical protein